MILINGKEFQRVPKFCGECNAWLDWNTGELGTCTLFNKRKAKYVNIPERCKRMFEKALEYPEGTELVLVAK